MRIGFLLLFILIGISGFSQEKKIYRIYKKDNTTIDVLNPRKVPDHVNFEGLDGISDNIEDSKYYTIRPVTQNQTKTTYPVKYTYCELYGIDNRKFWSIKSNLNVRVDYGENANEFESGYIIDENTGKVVVFTSMVQAMNFMGRNGWEFVQAYIVSEQSGGNVYRWLLKREIKE
jgi:hypothetical protein